MSNNELVDKIESWIYGHRWQTTPFDGDQFVVSIDDNSLENTDCIINYLESLKTKE